MNCYHCGEKTLTLCPFSIHLSKGGLIGLGFIAIAAWVGFWGITQIGGCIDREEAIANSMDPEWELIYRTLDEMPWASNDRSAALARLDILQSICENNSKNGIDMPALTPEQQGLLMSGFGDTRSDASTLLSEMTVQARLNAHVPGG